MQMMQNQQQNAGADVAALQEQQNELLDQQDQLVKSLQKLFSACAINLGMKTAVLNFWSWSKFKGESDPDAARGPPGTGRAPVPRMLSKTFAKLTKMFSRLLSAFPN